MTQQQQAAIDDIMDYFDFEKVHKHMAEVVWTWESVEDEVPSIGELRNEARRQLYSVAKPDQQLISSGGFTAIRFRHDDGKDSFHLMFCLTQWSGGDE
jgi:hypothetical protein